MKPESAFRQDRLRFYQTQHGTSAPGLLGRLKICVTDHGLHSVAVYRLGRASMNIYRRNRLAGFIPLLIYKILNHHIKTIHHVDISAEADIGPGLFIMHYYSIIIGPVKAGSNLTIHHNLTIGQKVANRDNSIPQIGNNVWIGPNCVITGNIKIGDGATISAGSVITKNIPENSLAGGNPGRVIIRGYDNRTMAIKRN